MTDTTSPAELSPWLTFSEVAKHYKASRQWIYSAIDRGEIPGPVHIGGKRLFSRSAIAAHDAAAVAKAEQAQATRLAALA